MSALITVLVIAVCILLLLIILIQNPKGGLDAAFSSNNQVMGVKKTTDFLEKATWTMGIALVVLSIASAAINPSRVVEEDNSGQSIIQEQIDEKSMPIQNVPENISGAPVPENQTSTSSEEKEE